MSNTIVLRGKGIYKEANAGGTITPGHLLMRSGANFVVHSAAEGNAYALFAHEQDFVGRDLNTNYTANERVLAIVPERGAEINALVPAAAPAIAVGDELVSNGDGTLKKVTAAALAVGNVRRVVAVALEAVNNSGGGTPARIRVEIV